MIRHRSRRMTVAHLKERMDARFKAVDQRFDAVDERFARLSARMDGGFATMHDKLSAMIRVLKSRDDHQQQIIDEHEERLRELETWQRTTRNDVR